MVPRQGDVKLLVHHRNNAPSAWPAAGTKRSGPSNRSLHAIRAHDRRQTVHVQKCHLRRGRRQRLVDSHNPLDDAPAVYPYRSIARDRERDEWTTRRGAGLGRHGSGARGRPVRGRACRRRSSRPAASRAWREPRMPAAPGASERRFGGAAASLEFVGGPWAIGTCACRSAARIPAGCGR